MSDREKKENILIVDDRTQNIQVLGSILRSEGYQIYVAKSGEQAIEIVKKAKIDLILLDVMMQGIDGFETCQQLKSQEGIKEIPVIFLTARVQQEDIIRGFEVGAVDYITKPFNAKELLVRSRTHLRQRQLIRELDETNKELNKMVITDSLTQLYNHKYIVDRLEQAIAESKRHTFSPLSLIMMDIDYFKQVNDNFGHQVGDDVLVTVSNIIKSTLRKTDLVGRYGGEEFLIILPNTNQENGFLVAEKIRQNIRQNRWDGIDLSVTISAGLCTLQEEEARTLISKSDKLLYQAKNKGRNRTEVELNS